MYNPRAGGFRLVENCHLSVQNDGKPVDAVDVETTWESLVFGARARS